MCTERELVLVKLKAPAGPARAEVMQLLQVFRARCVDISDQSVTVCCSGDAGKVMHCSIANLPFWSSHNGLLRRLATPAHFDHKHALEELV